MLIKNAWLQGRPVDVRVAATVEAIAPQLNAMRNESVLDAGGGEILPGLHEHHIHLFAAAAAQGSVSCNVGGGSLARCREVLAERLANAPGSGWIRGVDYHEQQLGELDRWRLDELCSHRPLRIQHRSGKLWVCNSIAVQALDLGAFTHLNGVQCDASGQLTGCVVRNDELMAQQLDAIGASSTPDIAAFSRQLASFGIVSVTDTSATNTQKSAVDLQRLRADGALLQQVSLMGDDTLDHGYLKVLLDEDRLPALQTLVARINAARSRGRNIAFHCVTHLELVFALAALADATPIEQGFDRIEHGAVIDDAMADELAARNLPVITQPGFLYSKGDQYRADLPQQELECLYRYAGLRARGVKVVPSSDAPYGPVSPWQNIATAACRRSAGGLSLGADECVSSDQALTGYLTPSALLDQPLTLAQAQEVCSGMRGDLCILQKCWEQGRDRPETVGVRATLIGGSVAFDGAD